MNHHRVEAPSQEVVTWNVDWWQRSAPQTERVSVVLARTRAVWLLQELRAAAMRELEQRWPGPCLFSVDVWPPGTRRWSSCAVLLPEGSEVQQAGCVAGLPRPQRGFWVTASMPVLGTVTLVSWHAENAAAGDAARLRKMQAYDEMNGWLAGQEGAIVLGVDANSWYDPADLRPPDPEDPFFAEHAFLGSDPDHGLIDAHRRQLENDGELDVLRHDRPDGPLATSYLLSNGVGHRMDRILTTPSLDVIDTGYDMAAARSAGSDHALHHAILTA